MDTIERDTRTGFDLARTGPGTLMGRFMRRFWIPVHRAEDLPQGHAKPIHIMERASPFPPYPAPVTEGLIETQTQLVPCNWLQCFENSMDEVHVAFVHRIGGSHSGIYDLPEIGAEETDWGMLRTGTRDGQVRISLHYMPNCTRVIVPPMAGLEGAGGWRELYLAFTPIDDETNRWFITNLVGVSGAAKETYLEKRDQYRRKQATMGPAEELAREVMAGRVRFAEIEHPDRVRVQDIAVQAGQGAIADRSNERLGRSDAAIILWRKILERELRAMDQGRKLKQWKPAPADVVPTLGF